MKHCEANTKVIVAIKEKLEESKEVFCCDHFYRAGK